MPRLYTAVRRPITVRKVNPLVLPQTPAPEPEPVPVPEPDPEPTPEPSTDMSLAELKSLADEAGVPSYGTKAAIVERLTDG